VPDLPFAGLLPACPGGEWSPVAAGESRAAVFRRNDGAAFAKCVGPEDVDELRAERDRTRWLAGTGIPGPAVTGWMSSEQGACLVLTAVPGVPADELSSAELLRAWPSMVRVLRRLHDLPVAGCPFDRTLSVMFRIAQDVVARDAVIPDFLTEDQRGVPARTLLADLRAELGTRLAQEARDLVVCHGDAGLPNFLVDADTPACTGLVDLGRLGVADRHADLALLRANARESWAGDDGARADELLARCYGPDRIDPERLRFYLYLDPLTWS
jgi:streptomycin 3"-kinase